MLSRSVHAIGRELLRSYWLPIAVLLASVLGACGPDNSVPDGDPAKRVGNDIRGYRVGPGVTIGSHFEMNWIQRSVTGFDRFASNGMPGAIIRVEGRQTCSLPRPAEGTIVATVHTNLPKMDSTIRQITKESIKSAAERMIKKAKRSKREPLAWEIARDQGDRLSVIDVVVTETAAPLHLLLVADDDVIWNLVKAEGARISHVTLLGGSSAGVANADDDTTISYLGKRRLASCDINPRRNPREHWRLFKNVANLRGGDEIIAENYGLHLQYDTWRRSVYGSIEEQYIVTAHQMHHALIGPVPENLEARIAYRSLDGATVQIAGKDYLTASDSQYQDELFASAKTLAERMSGMTITEMAALGRGR